MSQDLYAAWAGASAAWRQLEVVSGNVANANTPGYREQRVGFENEIGRGQAGARSLFEVGLSVRISFGLLAGLGLTFGAAGR